MKQDLWKLYADAYNQAYSVWSPWLAEAGKDLKFRLGDQWSWKDKVYLKQEGREPEVFNKIKRVVKLLSGYQRRNRLSLKVEPVEGSDEKTAGQFSGLLQYVMSRNNGYELTSDAFEHGSLVTGLNLIELSLLYDQDPVNGDFHFSRIPHNQVLLDPYFTERDLSDCGFVLRRKWLSRDTLRLFLPAFWGEIKKMVPQGKDGLFPESAPATYYNGDNLYRVDEFYRRTTRPAKLLVDRLTGAHRLWKGKDGQLKAFLQSADEQTGSSVSDRIQVLGHYYQSVDHGIMVEGETVYDESDVLGIDDYPFVAMLGDFIPEYPEMKDKLQGLVRLIRSPQKESNRRRVKILDLIDSVISSGFKAEENAVLDPRSLYQTGQNRVIWTQQGRLGAVEQLQGGAVPQSIFSIMETMDKDILDLPGVDNLVVAPEQQNQQIAAALAKLREGQGLTQQQDLFDCLRLAKKQLGGKLIEVIQTNWNPAKVQRVLNEQPTREFYDKDFGHYDCTPTEGMLTDTQKQTAFAELLAMKDMGAPVSWATLMKYSNISPDVKEDLKKEMAAAEQGQSQTAQMQMASQAVTDKLLQVESASRIASTQEKLAKIQTDLATAGLNRAKMIAEIQQMDADRLMQLLQLALQIEQGGQPTPANVVPMKKRVGMIRR